MLDMMAMPRPAMDIARLVACACACASSEDREGDEPGQLSQVKPSPLLLIPKTSNCQAETFALLHLQEKAMNFSSIQATLRHQPFDV